MSDAGEERRALQFRRPRFSALVKLWNVTTLSRLRLPRGRPQCEYGCEMPSGRGLGRRLCVEAAVLLLRRLRRRGRVHYGVPRLLGQLPARHA